MTDQSVVDRLVSHRTLGAAPREELEWLAAHGDLRHLAIGDSTAAEGEPITGMWIVLSGHISIRIHRDGGFRKVMEWRGGDVTGLLPYSRLTKPPGTVRADEQTEVLYVDGSHFRELIERCHGITAILVHVMLDRARAFTSSDLQVEKVLSLGRLAAGLAHELNNPASAVARSAATLGQDLADVEAASRALAAAGLSHEEVSALERVRVSCATEDDSIGRSPIERADREDAIAGWLADHGVDVRLAESLADSVVTVDAFDELASTLDGARLDAAIRWVASICGARRLAGEIETAASRIHHLVAAVRGFTYLDQATTPKSVDIAKGLSDTLIVLRSKARARSVTTNLVVAPDLPCVDGYGGELNQVWANLIDNALDAEPSGGHIDVSAGVEGRFLVVRVSDNGPGIPAEVQARVFEPFFTTKPVGIGTGLGLDIARRIMARHEGSLEFTTEPGHTEFRALLPLT